MASCARPVRRDFGVDRPAHPHRHLHRRRRSPRPPPGALRRAARQGPCSLRPAGIAACLGGVARLSPCRLGCRRDPVAQDQAGRRSHCCFEIAGPSRRRLGPSDPLQAARRERSAGVASLHHRPPDPLSPVGQRGRCGRLRRARSGPGRWSNSTTIARQPRWQQQTDHRALVRRHPPASRVLVPARQGTERHNPRPAIRLPWSATHPPASRRVLRCLLPILPRAFRRGGQPLSPRRSPEVKGQGAGPARPSVRKRTAFFGRDAVAALQRPSTRAPGR